VEVIQALKLEPRIMRDELSKHDWSGVKPMLPTSRAAFRVQMIVACSMASCGSCVRERRGAISQRTLDHTLATIASFAGDETKLWKHWPPLTTAR
jgi:hypothetical protein